jgi:hypothetical protein
VAAIMRELRELPQKVEEEPERAENRGPVPHRAQEGVQQPWWRRILGR